MKKKQWTGEIYDWIMLAIIIIASLAVTAPFLGIAIGYFIN